MNNIFRFPPLQLPIILPCYSFVIHAGSLGLKVP